MLIGLVTKTLKTMLLDRSIIFLSNNKYQIVACSLTLFEYKVLVDAIVKEI